jgi:hypothetical protein
MGQGRTEVGRELAAWAHSKALAHLNVDECRFVRCGFGRDALRGAPRHAAT